MVSGASTSWGQPKAGKSSFFMQVSTEAARQGVPVIYYDFENGRQKIYLRTLCRLSRLSEEALREQEPDSFCSFSWSPLPPCRLRSAPLLKVSRSLTGRGRDSIGSPCAVFIMV